jgi:hypothetical protein
MFSTLDREPANMRAYDFAQIVWLPLFLGGGVVTILTIQTNMVCSQTVLESDQDYLIDPDLFEVIASVVTPTPWHMPGDAGSLPTDWATAVYLIE